MKISSRQKEEISFLCTYILPYTPTEVEMEEYVKATVHGVSKVEDKLSENKIRHAKTSLDRSMKMWRAGLKEGTLRISDLEADFGQDPFGKKIIDTLRKYKEAL